VRAGGAAAGVALRRVAPRTAAPVRGGGAAVVRGVGGGSLVRPHEPVHVEVKPVDDRGVRADRREARESDPLVCVSSARVGKVCVPAPATHVPAP
jgi:hypothetical protein